MTLRVIALFFVVCLPAHAHGCGGCIPWYRGPPTPEPRPVCSSVEYLAFQKVLRWHCSKQPICSPDQYLKGATSTTKGTCTLTDEKFADLKAEEDGKFTVFLYIAVPVALVAQVVSYCGDNRDQDEEQGRGLRKGWHNPRIA